MRPWAIANLTPSVNMEMAMMLQSKRSSQRYMVMVRSGRRSMIEEHERVRKCEGLERTEGKCDKYAKRIALPILAWFFSPIAEISVAMIERRAAKSTDPGETRWCE